MPAIAAVFFDLDGTLVDDASNWHRSIAGTVNAVTDRHMHIDPDALEGAYYAASEAEWNRIKDAPSYPWGNMDAESIPRRVWMAALEHVRAADESIATLAAQTYVRLRNSNVPAFPDTADCVAALSPGYRLGIITNGYESTQLPKLEATGLASHFEAFVTVDIGSGKPQPEMFRYGLNSLDVEPSQAVYVGDGLHWDVGGANNAGMQSVWLNRHGFTRTDADPLPDAEITTLADLPAAIAALDSGASR